MRVLVLGAYGLIGSAITTALLRAGHHVTGLGRDVVAARQRWPEVTWVVRDLRHMQRAADWAPLLADIDAVVNAAGVLQDGVRDDVRAIQSGAMQALFATCTVGGPRRVVQISSIGAEPDAPTAFMRTKAAADAALAASNLDWIILRPGLVIGTTAYGVTALLRALAAFPLFIPLAAGAARVQTVATDDVAEAVLLALGGQVPSQRICDLVEDESHSLTEIVHAWRGHLGLPPVPVLSIPPNPARFSFRVGDLLGWLGWRTPLRSTAWLELHENVVGDPGPWRAVTGHGVAPMAATLRALPRSVQDIWFARLWLLKPVIIATLALFWVVSGVIALADIGVASRVLAVRGVATGWADAAVVIGANLDILLGLGVMARRYMPVACIGMMLLSLVYLLGGTVLAADLWVDPMGPLLKVLPGITLALVALALARDR